MHEILIHVKNQTFRGLLNDHSAVAREIRRRLPLLSRFNTWGNELYFPLSVSSTIEEPSFVVTVGDIAYSKKWQAFCIFYGKTPLSTGGQIVPNGPVQVVGTLNNPLALEKTLSGSFKNLRRRLCNRFPLLGGFVERIKIVNLYNQHHD